MTQITDRPTRRETSATYRGRPLMVSLHPRTLEIRQKGRRDRLTVPYDVIFEFAMKLRWRQQQADKRENKSRSPRSRSAR